jgi:hypothetical protein
MTRGHFLRQKGHDRRTDDEDTARSPAADHELLVTDPLHVIGRRNLKGGEERDHGHRDAEDNTGRVQAFHVEEHGCPQNDGPGCGVEDLKQKSVFHAREHGGWRRRIHARIKPQSRWNGYRISFLHSDD